MIRILSRVASTLWDLSTRNRTQNRCIHPCVRFNVESQIVHAQLIESLHLYLGTKTPLTQLNVITCRSKLTQVTEDLRDLN